MINKDKIEIRRFIKEQIKKQNLLQSKLNTNISVSIYHEQNKIIIKSNNEFVKIGKFRSRYNKFINNLTDMLIESELEISKIYIKEPMLDYNTITILYDLNDMKEVKKVECSKDINNKVNQNISKKYLNTDKLRINIESYDEQILTDINRGHWELKDEKNLVYKDPRKDINKGCVVGIDFGTKSTIVVCQNKNEVILPMMIGGGKLKESIDKKSYENPTILEFINIDKFIKDYKALDGRPETKWEDLTISHTANEAMLNSSSQDYYSFFNELKQWCASSGNSINIKDKNKNTITLNKFLQLKENEFNPIEVYAYYLGLYINNMRNGIFLDYLLSFPVTYEKDIRDKIIESFERGLKKSFPSEVLKDSEVMNDFKVSMGASEPAAYAISALTEYGFDPEDDEKIFYGVFDFGGGTTDFDFGIFREANQKGERRYDYVIEHFGAGGDKYLGGENLLHLISFEVFKDNAPYLRKQKVSFRLHPECKMFVGGEFLVNESQEARLNTRQVMEKLRPIWERSDEYKKILEKGVINTNLYANNGQMITNVELKVDVNKIDNILKDRIEKGVQNFFEGLRIAFNNDEASDVDNIKIFLAGNSSKSVFVKELFDKYTEIENNCLFEAVHSEVALTIEGNVFDVYPPLGTEEAYEKQEELGIDICKDDLEKPTGKTGVAFGLIESRSGGSIKVINKNIENDDVRFRYYVGMKKKKKLNPILTPENNYNEWVEFIDAYEKDFEIHYTTSPKASTKNMDITETTRIKITLDETYEEDDIFVYIRATSPSEIEYVVAKEDTMDNLSEIQKIKLD